VILVAACNRGGFYVARARCTSLTEKDSVVLAEFAQNHRRYGIRRYARMGFGELEPSQFMSCFGQRGRQKLALMDQPKDARYLSPLLPPPPSHSNGPRVCQRPARLPASKARISSSGHE